MSVWEGFTQGDYKEVWSSIHMSCSPKLLEKAGYIGEYIGTTIKGGY